MFKSRQALTVKHVRVQWRKYWRGGKLILLIESLSIRAKGEFVVTETIILEIRKLRSRRSSDSPEETELVGAKPKLKPVFSVSRTQGLNFWLSNASQRLQKPGPFALRGFCWPKCGGLLWGKDQWEGGCHHSPALSSSPSCSPSFSFFFSPSFPFLLLFLCNHVVFFKSSCLT